MLNAVKLIRIINFTIVFLNFFKLSLCNPIIAQLEHVHEDHNEHYCISVNNTHIQHLDLKLLKGEWHDVVRTKYVFKEKTWKNGMAGVSFYNNQTKFEVIYTGIDSEKNCELSNPLLVDYTNNPTLGVFSYENKNGSLKILNSLNENNTILVIAICYEGENLVEYCDDDSLDISIWSNESHLKEKTDFDELETHLKNYCIDDDSDDLVKYDFDSSISCSVHISNENTNHTGESIILVGKVLDENSDNSTNSTNETIVIEAEITNSENNTHESNSTTVKVELTTETTSSSYSNSTSVDIDIDLEISNNATETELITIEKLVGENTVVNNSNSMNETSKDNYSINWFQVADIVINNTDIGVEESNHTKEVNSTFLKEQVINLNSAIVVNMNNLNNSSNQTSDEISSDIIVLTHENSSKLISDELEEFIIPRASLNSSHTFDNSTMKSVTNNSSDHKETVDDDIDVIEIPSETTSRGNTKFSPVEESSGDSEIIVSFPIDGETSVLSKPSHQLELGLKKQILQNVKNFTEENKEEDHTTVDSNIDYTKVKDVEYEEKTKTTINDIIEMDNHHEATEEVEIKNNTEVVKTTTEHAENATESSESTTLENLHKVNETDEVIVDVKVEESISTETATTTTATTSATSETTTEHKITESEYTTTESKAETESTSVSTEKVTIPTENSVSLNTDFTVQHVQTDLNNTEIKKNLEDTELDEVIEKNERNSKNKNLKTEEKILDTTEASTTTAENEPKSVTVVTEDVELTTLVNDPTTVLSTESITESILQFIQKVENSTKEDPALTNLDIEVVVTKYETSTHSNEIQDTTISDTENLVSNAEQVSTEESNIVESSTKEQETENQEPKVKNHEVNVSDSIQEADDFDSKEKKLEMTTTEESLTHETTSEGTTSEETTTEETSTVTTEETTTEETTTESTTTPYPCVELNCPIPFCKYGRKKDENGCNLCDCLKNPNLTNECTETSCQRCFYGSYTDEYGCDTCACKSRPKPKSVYECPKLDCDSCNYGSIKDEYGCETCICIRPNSLETPYPCPTELSCPYGACNYGSVLNEYGCGTCDCLKSADHERDECVKQRCPPCQNGYFTDSNGCETCLCKPDWMAPCGLVQLNCNASECQHGFYLDRNGCPSCECLPDPNEKLICDPDEIQNAYNFTDCNNDGTFKSKQCNDQECRCVTKFGAFISDFNAPVSESIYMNCECAAALYEVSVYNAVGFKLYCSSNGNYETIQCVGASCACVNEHGDPLGPSVPVYQKHLLRCEGVFQRVYFDQFLTTIAPTTLTPPLCVYHRERALEMSNIDAHMSIPECDERGLYDPLQCDRQKKYCWCVNIHNGVELQGTRMTGEKPDCNHSG